MLPVPRILRFCNYLQNAVANTYIFVLQLSTFIFYNKQAKPLIINSDQGSQFTSDKYIDFIRDNGIRQSMDGKSRWADNIMIERWFRSFKYEEAYLTEYANLKEAREAIGKYIYTYNFERCHQAIGNKRPAEVYYPAMLLDAARAAA